jgi:hypothetical protein
VTRKSLGEAEQAEIWRLASSASPGRCCVLGRLHGGAIPASSDHPDPRLSYSVLALRVRRHT